MKDVHASLISKVAHYNNVFRETCVAVEKSENEYAIAVCTPLMKKCHSLIKSIDIVYIETCDCPTNKDNQNHHILLLYAHTPVGGVPLGAVLLSTGNKDILIVGFQLLKKLLPDKAFGDRGVSGPQIFLIKDSDDQKKALNTVWPNSDVIVCSFRILQNMWEWLWDEKHNVLRDHRLYLLYLLKTVLFASSDSDMATKYQVLCSDSIALHYPVYMHQLECLWQKRHLWALCFHELLPLQDANNYYEAAVRSLKDKIFEQVKSFNFIQLLNFLVTHIDLFYESKFLKILEEKIDHIFISYFPDTIPAHIVNSIKQIAGSYYVVPSENRDDKFYTVDVELNSCSCPIGLNGALCIHQHWLFLRTVQPPELFKANITNVNFRQKLFMTVSRSLLSSEPILINNATKSNLKYNSTAESTKHSKQSSFTESINLNQSDSEINSKNIQCDNELSLSCSETFSLKSSNSHKNFIFNPLPFNIAVPSDLCVNSTLNISTLNPENESHIKDFSKLKEVNDSNEMKTENSDFLNLKKITALKNFEKFYQRVKNGVENQTEEFLPALEIMLKNLERKGNTDEQIILGLNFFGIVSAPSLENRRKKRPVLTHTSEEIIPLVYGRKMITYGKKKCVEQVKNTSHDETQSIDINSLPNIEVTKTVDDKSIFGVDA